jgi:hypothetical protein
MKTKHLAESQFDSSAAPISLGLQFSNFTNFTFDLDSIEQDDDQSPVSTVGLFSDEIDSINSDPRSIVLLANDLNPTKRDQLAQQAKITSETTVQEHKSVENLAQSLQVPMMSSDNPRNVKSVDFQIQNSEFKRQIQGFDKANKTVTAIRLAMLAIEKFDIEERKALHLSDPEYGDEFDFHKILIDKNPSSVHFINKIGKIIQNEILIKFPNRFKMTVIDRDLDVEYLNEHIPKNKIDMLYQNAILAKYVTYSHIELNSFPGLDIGCKGHQRYKTCHQILSQLNFSTMNVDSANFRNLKNLTQFFPIRYNADRLHYLEYLISEAERGNLFFRSRFVTFFENDEYRWSNDDFPGLNKMLNQWWTSVQQ